MGVGWYSVGKSAVVYDTWPEHNDRCYSARISQQAQRIECKRRLKQQINISAKQRPRRKRSDRIKKSNMCCPCSLLRNNGEQRGAQDRAY